MVVGWAVGVSVLGFLFGVSVWGFIIGWGFCLWVSWGWAGLGSLAHLLWFGLPLPRFSTGSLVILTSAGILVGALRGTE